MKNLTIRQKRRTLARFIECQVAQGNAIDWVFAKPLNWFDYKYLIKEIHFIESGDQMEYSKDELYKIY